VKLAEWNDFVESIDMIEEDQTWGCIFDIDSFVLNYLS
jgi:hypothetical protein